MRIRGDFSDFMSQTISFLARHAVGPITTIATLTVHARIVSRSECDTY